MTAVTVAHRWWLIWFCLWFGSFLAVEIWALIFNWRCTLSSWVWSFEKFQPNQPMRHWTALHFLFIAALFVVALWLLGHFGFGWWR